MSKRTLIGIIFAGLALVAGVFALTVFLNHQGLDRADKWASVMGLFVAVASLVVAGAALLPQFTKSENGSTRRGNINVEAHGVEQLIIEPREPVIHNSYHDYAGSGRKRRQN